MPSVVHKELPHVLELLKIVEGAVNADREKVASYTELLASKLAAEGHKTIADRLQRTLQSSKTRMLELSRSIAAPGIPVDQESRLALADEQLFASGDAVVFVAPEVTAAVHEFVRFVLGADRLVSQGVGVSPSMLLFGPPGCGKTELAKYVASQLGLPLLTARSDSLISSFLGSTAKNLRTLFDHATARPCVLFLDEFDALAKARDDKNELGELKRVVVSLLQNIDALESKTVLLAATNHEHLLDPAIWRRFAFRLQIGLPGPEARRAMFQRFCGDFAQDDEIRVFAAVSETLSGSDIRQVAEDSKRRAILSDLTRVDTAEVLRRILNHRLPDLMKDSVSLEARVAAARRLAPDFFTYRRLSEVFGVSLGRLSKLLREE